MERLPDDIKTIDGTKETLKLGVRITSLWYCTNRDNNAQLDMVVMDCKGDKIQVVVRRDEVETWKYILIEGKIYYMHNFRVVSNEGQFKVCNHPFKLLFMSGTTLRETDELDIPINVYNFKDFSDIISGNYRRDLLVDVIGVVHKVTFLGLNSSPKKVVFNLRDYSGDLLSCTLWEDYAMKFVEFYNQKLNADSFIIMLTQARIKEAQGTYPLSVSNSFYGSKLIMNEDFPEIQQFKERYDAIDFNDAEEDSQRTTPLTAISPMFVCSQSTGSSQHYGWTHFSEQDKFMYKAPVKSLQEINAVTKELSFVTVGTTGKIVVSPNGWYYESCNRCNKKAERLDEPFTCQCGCYNEKYVLRYKLEVEVYHNKMNSKFAFFDRDCIHLIGMTALELKKLAIASGEIDDPKVYPAPLDQILGYTLAFRVKVHPKFNNSSVMRMSDDKDLIKCIIEQLSANEGKVVSEKGTISLNSASQNDTQSLSATAENDPDVSTLVTPAKRQLPEMESLDTISPDLPLAKLSSTKLSKHIKTE